MTTLISVTSMYFVKSGRTIVSEQTSSTQSRTLRNWTEWFGGICLYWTIKWTIWWSGIWTVRSTCEKWQPCNNGSSLITRSTWWGIISITAIMNTRLWEVIQLKYQYVIITISTLWPSVGLFGIKIHQRRDLVQGLATIFISKSSKEAWGEDQRLLTEIFWPIVRQDAVTSFKLEFHQHFK